MRGWLRDSDSIANVENSKVMPGDLCGLKIITGPNNEYSPQ